MTVRIIEININKSGMKMEKIRLIRPNNNLEDEYLDMVTEWKKSKEELIPWSLNLYDNDFKLMVEKLNGYSKGIGLPDGYVENSTYWLWYQT